MVIKVHFVTHLKRKPTPFEEFHLGKWYRRQGRLFVWEKIPVPSGLKKYFDHNVFSKVYQDSSITSSQEPLIGWLTGVLSLFISPFPSLGGAYTDSGNTSPLFCVLTLRILAENITGRRKTGQMEVGGASQNTTNVLPTDILSTPLLSWHAHGGCAL